MSEKIWLRPSKSPWSLKIKIKLSLWLLIQKTIFRFSPHKLNFFRIFLLKLFGAKIGNNCFIHQSVNIYMPWNLEIGTFSSIDFDAIIYSISKIKIGKMGVIGARSVVTKNMPDSYISFGNPCKPYKIREPQKDTI
ncbi:MAG: Acetyltransferase, CysE/LacA/LpxA/NodL family [uncultured Sulfurovum sp.]|uniref:Acetyltransferase, CysE/LacA/LpxA/NodL family n=1 Tax=uncultured Sulfurovum sp. TaxID=269237 RepID=A0A6S6UE16_9BACT|nr:MAG: Acetyltransferase, CysE/LacA/LpxA/NodL family [uncultured Sulfurovum sp.]